MGVAALQEPVDFASLPDALVCNGIRFDRTDFLDDFEKLIGVPAGAIVDGGAGGGRFAEQCRKRWPTVPILSYECEPSCLEKLRGLKLSDHIIEPFALWDSDCTADFHIAENVESSSLLGFLDGNILDDYTRPIKTIRVATRRLDDVASAYNVALIKLDVQGAEPQALEGAERLLGIGVPVYCEVAIKPQYEGHMLLPEFDAFMAGYGYRRVRLYSSCRPDIWGDALYVKGNTLQVSDKPLRLNIGAGCTPIDGFKAIDKKTGTEAFPLPYPDNSVEEIRASHILEHFSFKDSEQALLDWVRVLKPGGRIRLAVPDVVKVFECGKTDPAWQWHLMGGQTDENDFHRSCWVESGLRSLMVRCGIENIQPWTSDNTDCAALPISLNLEGVKSNRPPPDMLKIAAVMGIPRFGCNDSWGVIVEALSPHRIPLYRYGGVFWGQCMQRAFNDCIRSGVDWILTIDYDSIITANHVSLLLQELAKNTQIDALAAMQVRRGSKYPLMTVGGESGTWVGTEPKLVTTAHFGLTLLQVDSLKEVPKPWFYGKPDKDGEWLNDKMDDDIWFWHQWRLAGKNVYVSPKVRIGHMESMVAEFDSEMQIRHVYMQDWRKENGLCGSSNSNDNMACIVSDKSSNSRPGLPMFSSGAESQSVPTVRDMPPT